MSQQYPHILYKTMPVKDPFKKHRLSFSSHQGKLIFGQHFKTGKNNAIQSATKLLLSDQLNEDGTINEASLTFIPDADIWSYIYYLYAFNNEDIHDFQQMKGEDGQASAEKFYDVVRSRVDNSYLKVQNDIQKLSTPDLIKFIKIVITKYRGQIKNPVVDHYNIMLQQKIGNAFTQSVNNVNVVVRTGQKNSRVVTNAKNVAQSDIVISFSMKPNKK